MSSFLCPKKGTYQLVLELDTEAHFVRVGPFKEVTLVPGYYSYIGSALGSGGIQGRIGHHLRDNSSNPHWHLDYVRPRMRIVEAWVTFDPVRRECNWSHVTRDALRGHAVVEGLGSADCEICPAHFYYFGENDPSFRKFVSAVRHAHPGHASVHRIEFDVAG